MNSEFYSALKARRTIYGISKESPVPDERLLEVIRQAVAHAPSAFNSQSGRVILLLGENSNLLWDITKDTLRKIVSAESFPKTEEKIDSFKSGYGTILFFEDQETVEKLQAQFPTYKDNFPVWSLQSSGMLQYIVWTSLEIEGYGASLQHYNPLIDEQVKSRFKVPGSWRLLAQMPFGKPTAPAGEKTFLPLDERIKVFK